MKLKTILEATTKRLDLIFTLIPEIARMQEEDESLKPFGVNLANDIAAKNRELGIAIRKYRRIYIAFYKRVLIADMKEPVTQQEFWAVMTLYKMNATQNKLDLLDIEAT